AGATLTELHHWFLFVYRLISLAGPGPSGSTRPSRLCQRCFPPSPASPGSDCAPLLPGRCDGPARRSSTSFGSQRLTAHWRLVAHEGVIPVAVPVVAAQRQGLHLPVTDLDSGVVGAGVQFGVHAQPGAGGGGGD